MFSGALALMLSMPVFAVDVQVSRLVDVPDPAVRGGVITYEIDVENNAGDTANEVELSFPLPATTVFEAVDNASCAHDGGAPGTVTCTYGSLVGSAVGGPVLTANIEVRTTAATGNTVDVTATASTADSDANGANDSLNQNTTIDDGADLMPIFVSATPDPVIGGGSVTYVAEVSNNGPNNSASPQVVFQLSTNVTFVSMTDADWTCSHDNVDPGGQLTCTRGSLANGATSPQISFETQVTGAATGTLTTTATTSAATGDPEPNNDVASINVQVNTGTDIAVTIANPGAVIENTNFDLVVRPRNNGPTDAANPSVEIEIATGFVINGDDTSPFGSNGWSCTIAGRIVTCTGGSLTVGATNNILVPLAAPGVASQQSFTNPPGATIDSDASEAPDRLANNADTATITVNPNGVDLETLKTKGPQPVAQGSPITSTIRVRNNGPLGAASGTITVTESLLAGETYDGHSGANWVCVPGSGPIAGPTDIDCTYNASLNNGNLSSTLTINTTASGTGNLTNTACAATNATPGEINPGNDCDTGTVTSTAAIADLQVSKTAVAGQGPDDADGDPSVLAADGGAGQLEDTVVYTITVLNDGPAAVGGIVIEDDLPVYAGFNGGSGVTANITSAPGGVTFNCNVAGNGDVTCTQTGGTMNAGESVVLTIEASRPLRDGSRTNTASAFSNTVGDDDRSNNTAQATVQVDAVADIQVQSKTVTPTPVRAGVNATYTITVHNNGPSTAQDVEVTDVFTLPGGDTGFTFISDNPSQGSCSGLVADAVYISTDNPTLTCDLGSMGRNNTETIQLTLRPNWISGDAARQFTNQATATTTTWESDDTNNDGNGEDETNSNNINSAILDIQASEIDLLINNTDVPDPLGWDPASGGDTSANDVVYDVESRNRGPSLATGTQFVYTMTPKASKTVRFECDEAASGDACGTSADQCSISNGTNPVTGPATLELTCNIGNLVDGVWQMPADSTFDRFLRFRVLSQPDTTGDTHATNATISGNEVENILGNNAEAENTSVRAKIDLALDKSAGASPLQLHEPFDWIIEVTNNGPLASEQTGLTDTLPAGMRFQGAVPSWTNPGDSDSGLCMTSGFDMSCDLNTVSVGSTVTITVPVLIDTFTGNSVQNCANVAAEPGTAVDSDPSNNENCGTVSVTNSFFPSDYGDAPDTGVGTAPGNYQTTFADGGPRHLSPGGNTWLGACVDADGAGTQQNVAADADDTTAGTVTAGSCGGNDDEDGVTLPPAFVAGAMTSLDVVIANNTCALDGWIDYNADGVLEDAAGERLFNAESLTAGPHTLAVNVPAGIAPGVSYARFRCSDSGGLTPTEEVTGGEIEDYRVSLQPDPDSAPTPTDYGDAPDATAGTSTGDYNTRGVDDGASHVLGVADAPYLGACVDSDTGLQQGVDALADDNTAAGGSGAPVTTGSCAGAGDDEDGVSFADTIVLGLSTDITVNAAAGTNDCRLDAWIDFNADGDFLDADEQIATDQLIASGTSAGLSVNVPLTGAAGETYARFRCSSAGGLEPTGAESDGEVEDYRVELFTPDPALELVKVLSDAPDPIMLGSLLEFTIVATNSGNVTLSNVLVTDSLVTPIGGTTPCASVAPGGICTLVGTYEVTQLDIDNGEVFNTAGADSDQTDPIETSLLTPVPQNSAIDLVKEAGLNDINSNGLGDVGEIIHYTITVTNNGNVTLTTVNVEDSLIDVSCVPEIPLTLAPKEQTVCSGNYTATQSDIDDGSPIINTVTASGLDPDDNVVEDEDDVSVPVSEAAPAISLTKLITDGSPYLAVDDVINYQITATNTGNVTLSGVEISDPQVTLGTCTPAQPTALARAATLICQASYTITQAEIDAGSFTNTAEAGGSDPDGQPVTASDSATANSTATPSLAIDKSQTSGPNPVTAAGEELGYEIVVENTGAVTLTDIEISDTLPDRSEGSLEGPTESISPDGVLEVGESWVWTISYTVTQGDLDAGADLVNSASVTTAEVPGPTTAIETTAIEVNPALAIVKTGTFNDEHGDGFGQVGETISYAFEVTNTGNVVIKDVAVSDPLLTVNGGPLASLVVGASDATTFTGTYTLTQADIDAGEVENQATATGQDPTGTEVSDVSDDDSPGEDDPTLTPLGAPSDSPMPVPSRSWWMILVMLTAIAAIGKHRLTFSGQFRK